MNSSGTVSVTSISRYLFPSQKTGVFEGIHWRAPDGTCYPLDFGIPHLDRRWSVFRWLVVPIGKMVGETGIYGMAPCSCFCSSNLGEKLLE